MYTMHEMLEKEISRLETTINRQAIALKKNKDELDILQETLAGQTQLDLKAAKVPAKK